MIPKATLFLATCLILVYIFLSQAFLYIPNSTLLPLALSWQTLWGLLIYPFLHVGPGHLVANVAFLLCVGFAAEKKLKPKDIILLFLLASITAGIVFLIIQPGNYLVGASAGIAGIFGAAFFSDLRRLLFGLIIFIAFLIAFTPLLDKAVMQAYQQLWEERQKALETLKEKHNILEQLNRQKEEILDNISAIEERKEELGEMYYILKNQLESQLNAVQEEMENVAREKGEWEKVYEEKSLKYLYLEEGIEREKEAIINHVLHLAGAWIGIGYVIIFRRDLLWRRVSQVLSFIRSLKT